MQIQHATIDKRPYTVFNATEDISVFLEHNTLFDLSYLCLLQAQGAQAQDFLQGQLSCDVKEVDEQYVRQGALCNLQGRIISLMDVVLLQKTFSLILPEDLVEKTLKILNKPALFSRVNLQVNSSFTLLGFYLNNSNDLLPFSEPMSTELYGVTQHTNGLSYCVGPNVYILIVNHDQKAGLIESFIQQKKYAGSLAWHALRLKQHQFEIYPATSGLFLPHRLNLHLTGYLNFNKGCYRGQEIIARTHYRATLKHTLKAFEIECPTEPLIGTAIKTQQRQDIGELVDFYPTGPNRYYIIASVLFEHPLEAMFANHSEVIKLYHPQ